MSCFNVLNTYDFCHAVHSCSAYIHCLSEWFWSLLDAPPKKHGLL